MIEVVIEVVIEVDAVVGTIVATMTAVVVGVVMIVAMMTVAVVGEEIHLHVGVGIAGTQAEEVAKSHCAVESHAMIAMIAGLHQLGEMTEPLAGVLVMILVLQHEKERPQQIANALAQMHQVSLKAIQL